MSTRACEFMKLLYFYLKLQLLHSKKISSLATLDSQKLADHKKKNNFVRYAHNEPKGIVHKRRPHKIAKNWPLPSLSVQTRYKFWKIRSFLHQNVRTSASEKPFSPPVRTGQMPLPLTADFLYGQPLTFCDLRTMYELACYRARNVTVRFYLLPDKRVYNIDDNNT